MASRIAGQAQTYLSKLIALQKPVVYNTKVAVELAKQVYVKEGMAFPTGAQFNEANQAVQNALKLKNLKNLTFSDVAKGSVILAEIYTFFLVGEIVGRRNLIGYNVESESHAAH